MPTPDYQTRLEELKRQIYNHERHVSFLNWALQPFYKFGSAPGTCYQKGYTFRGAEVEINIQKKDPLTPDLLIVNQEKKKAYIFDVKGSLPISNDHLEKKIKQIYDYSQIDPKFLSNNNGIPIEIKSIEVGLICDAGSYPLYQKYKEHIQKNGTFSVEFKQFVEKLPYVSLISEKELLLLNDGAFEDPVLTADLKNGVHFKKATPKLITLPQNTPLPIITEWVWQSLWSEAVKNNFWDERYPFRISDIEHLAKEQPIKKNRLEEAVKLGVDAEIFSKNPNGQYLLNAVINNMRSIKSAQEKAKEKTKEKYIENNYGIQKLA